jgi:hypothetical protein
MVEMNMNAAEKILVELLCPELQDLGFAWRKGREMFVRQRAGGFDCFLWSSHSAHVEGGRLELVPIIGVRHDEVEHLVNQLGLIHGAENQRFTTTVDRGLGHFPLVDGKNYAQHIRLASAGPDLELVKKNFIEILTNEGASFFKKYASVLECSKGLNEPIASRTHPLCNNFPRRAYYGIACAAIAELHLVDLLLAKYKDYAAHVLPGQIGRIEAKLNELM